MIIMVAWAFVQHSPMFGQRPHHIACGGIFAGDRRLDPDPVRFAQDFLIGAVRLFRVPESLEMVDHDGHG